MRPDWGPPDSSFHSAGQCGVFAKLMPRQRAPNTHCRLALLADLRVAPDQAPCLHWPPVTGAAGRRSSDSPDRWARSWRRRLTTAGERARLASMRFLKKRVKPQRATPKPVDERRGLLVGRCASGRRRDLREPPDHFGLGQGAKQSLRVEGLGLWHLGEPSAAVSRTLKQG